MKTKFIMGCLLASIFFVSCGSDKKPVEEETVIEETTPPEEGEVIEEEVVVASGALEGKAIFESKGCVACHQETTKVVGPALNKIAIAYDGFRDGLKAFLLEKGEAIVDPAQAAIMQPQLKITKEMPDADLEKVLDYIMSVK